MRWDRTLTRRALFAAANKYAAAQLALHRQYAAWTGIEALANTDRAIWKKSCSRPRRMAPVCCRSVGVEASPANPPSPDTTGEDYRKILGAQSFYQRAIQSGLPFPKTRRIVFTGDRPTTLPGWVYLEVA